VQRRRSAWPAAARILPPGARVEEEAEAETTSHREDRGRDARFCVAANLPAGGAATQRYRGGVTRDTSEMTGKKKSGLKGKMRRFTAPIEELDREQLADFCSTLGLTRTTAIEDRQRVRLGGEVRSVRVVPRAGAPALEVTVSDGDGVATAVFLGRRSIAGITPGRKMTFEGVVGRDGNRKLVYNPLYTLLP
jgi:hypothetical protein